jgi:hypothetical protein
LDDLKNKADTVDKLFGDINPDDLLDELNKLRDKANAFDSLMKKLGGKDPGRPNQFNILYR